MNPQIFVKVGQVVVSAVLAVAALIDAMAKYKEAEARRIDEQRRLEEQYTSYYSDDD